MIYLCTCGHKTDNWPAHKAHIENCVKYHTPTKLGYFHRKADPRFKRFYNT